MSTIHRVVIEGDFNDDEFFELVAFLRAMDTRRPTANFTFAATVVERPSAEEFMRAAFPPMPGRHTEWTACDTVDLAEKVKGWGR